MAFAAGFIDSIAGGGGLLMSPAYLLAGIPPTLALATNKLVSTMGTSVATANFYRKGKISLKVVAYGALLTWVGAALGSKCLLLVPQDMVAKVVMILLPVAAVAVLYPKKSLKSLDALRKRDYGIIIPLIGLVIGFYDGFFGPGSGSFLVIAFHVLLGMSLIASSANAKAFNLVSNVGALIVFMVNGKILYMLGIPLALGSMAGNFAGSHLAMKKGDGLVRLVLILALVGLLASLAVKTIF